MCIYCRLRSLVGTPLFNQSEKYKLCEDTSKKGAFLRWRLTIETKEQNVNQSFYDIKMYLLPPELCSHLATLGPITDSTRKTLVPLALSFFTYKV